MSHKGILLLNLGSPDSPSPADVRRYLAEFLMDGRVLDVPWLIRFFVVHLGILPSRSHLSAEAYGKIWTPEGSPLVVMGRRVQAGLQPRVNLPVELAMCYRHPGIDAALERLRDQGVTELLLIPLFPHYAMSSYETAVVRAKERLVAVAPGMTLRVQPPFYDDPDYIRAMAGHAENFLRQEYDHLLFSFHGLPERHLRKSDPTGRHCLASPDCCNTPSAAHATCYRAQCFKTVASFVKLAGVTKYSVAFQSRLGREPWLKPYTDELLASLPSTGVRRLLVICPSFVADCLETLEEIGIRGRRTFLDAGGTDLTLLPCLNDHPLWLDALEKMVGRLAA
jgi:protoporphyrin/coproporphyrin ferrochelatase